MYKYLKRTGNLLICLSLSFGFVILVLVIWHFTNFSGDQINDAYRVMGIWEGSPPTLGPGPAAWSEVSGEIYLPPLYYYLVFPFTALTADLSSQAMSNGVLTFLSIPLLTFTLYRLLENVDHKKRYFIAALGGFWYAFLFRNIVMSTGDSLAGNPVSIPFFLLGLILLYTYQLQSKLSPRIEILSWIVYGLSLAILVSLHFSTLFVMPVIFIASLVFYISRNPKTPKRWLLPGLAILSAILALTPYWIGEIGRNWINTRNIISLIFDASSKDGYSVTFIQRLQAIVRSYTDLGNEVYFIGYSWKSNIISIAFLLTVLIMGIVKFKGNKIIWGLLLGTWAVFVYAYSSTNMEETYNPVFYKILIYLAPIFLTICSLGYLNLSKKFDKLFLGFIVFGITVSIIINLKYHWNYLSSRYGTPRVANTSDLVEVLNQVPEQSTICHPGGRYRDIRIHEYNDHYLNKRELKFIPECQSGHYIIYKKYESVGDFTLRPTQPIGERFDEFDKKYTLFQETPNFYIYRVDN